MKRAIVVVAATLIVTAGQAMAEGLTPPHLNGLSPSFVPFCYCTCLDYCCPKCPDDELGHSDGRPNKGGTAISYYPGELPVTVIRPNTARPKQFERTTNRYSTPIAGATPNLSPKRSCSTASGT